MVDQIKAAGTTDAAILVDEVLCEQAQLHVPAAVTQIVERHRETLLGLAHALIAAGRSEQDVIGILHAASESFSTKLKSEIERMPS